MFRVTAFDVFDTDVYVRRYTRTDHGSGNVEKNLTRTKRILTSKSRGVRCPRNRRYSLCTLTGWRKRRKRVKSLIEFYARSIGVLVIVTCRLRFNPPINPFILLLLLLLRGFKDKKKRPKRRYRRMRDKELFHNWIVVVVFFFPLHPTFAYPRTRRRFVNCTTDVRQ